MAVPLFMDMFRRPFSRCVLQRGSTWTVSTYGSYVAIPWDVAGLVDPDFTFSAPGTAVTVNFAGTVLLNAHLSISRSTSATGPLTGWASFRRSGTTVGHWSRGYSLGAAYDAWQINLCDIRTCAKGQTFDLVVQLGRSGTDDWYLAAWFGEMTLLRIG